MLKIGILDDGVGVFPTYYKLKQAVSAEFLCEVYSVTRFVTLPNERLIGEANQAIAQLVDAGCEAIVISSVSLSALAYKRLQNFCPVPLYSCDAPVMHASTYTASGVLAVGSRRVVNRLSSPTVTPCAMDDFPHLAEEGNERLLVEYIEKSLSPYEGTFYCIALADSSMNVYKRCFSRVVPNVHVFDSLEGVARRLRKKYKKSAKEESTCLLIDHNGEKICEKYAIFLE